MISDERSAQDWLANLPEYDAPAQARLANFIKLLVAENTRQNLVSAGSLAHVWHRHIADSAQLLDHVPRETEATWLDLGTGAGFPGMIIAILRPDTEVAMVESRGGRVAWLEYVKSALGLTQAKVVATKIEALETQSVSVISARAFAPLDRLLALSARFSTAQTFWLLPKGRSAVHEMQALTGWRHRFHVEQSLTQAGAGIIVGHLDDNVRHCT